MVKVPVVWEVSPRGGSVTIASGAACFIGLVGLGLVFQDLWDDTTIGFGGNKYLWQNQGVCWSGGSFTLVFLDSSRLCLGQGGAWGRGQRVGIMVVTSDGVGRVWW